MVSTLPSQIQKYNQEPFLYLWSQKRALIHSAQMWTLLTVTYTHACAIHGNKFLHFVYSFKLTTLNKATEKDVNKTQILTFISK